jgi:hypothetical protein
MSTVVYDNTDKPYVEWKPAYVILGRFNKGTWLPFWMEWELYSKWKPEADKLVAEFWKGGRWGKRTFQVCRYQKYICEAIATIINDNVEGLRCSVEYPDFDTPKGHVRLFHLER